MAPNLHQRRPNKEAPAPEDSTEDQTMKKIRMAELADHEISIENVVYE